MKKSITVVAGIVWDGDRYLAARRPKDAPFGGFWEFPGGKIEPDETPEEALVREFQEELDITPTKWSYWQTVTHEYEELVVTLLFFHITAFTGTLVPQEGHTVQWVMPEEACNLGFLEADIPIVQALATST
ncbi:(deoxy)nucleoside triphosphate pyrophosphohydrolase [Halodesulfovibrio sp.]|jgi:8-oxo-dGTP diphosphatase|uniref:(deoxy)nucleoside triphosphate pyrophosphohydrolase n=1 Tax=Halodesulfovibrio sp. TaxID=1912772 RepID=UPI0025DF0ACC|nr:(deoxy)nucleoside triphosphate pyrophosphohydrolase [Halodesulfovibrio sp.]MCT4534718.1 (deoxy)nucleoside triphosphate pyrophosphohydrolase [Halodesulfovibrio sp.]